MGPDVIDLTTSSDIEEVEIKSASGPAAPLVPRGAPLPEVIDLVDDEDEVQIVEEAPHKTAQAAERQQEPIEPPEVQEQLTIDISDLSIDEQLLAPPPPPDFPFPDPTPFERRIRPVASPLPAPALPPAIRPGPRSILGQRILNAIGSDRIVQMVGLKDLKAAGWKLERREHQVASAEPNVMPPRPRPDKGKGRAPGERTRDWTPLVRREHERLEASQAARSQTVVEFRLVPPRPQTTELAHGRDAHPPRQPRKTTKAVYRDNTVKLEPVEFSFS